MDKTAHHKKAMIDALEKTLGVVTDACNAVGIGRSTHYMWMREDKEYADAVDSITDICVDFAESKLFDLVDKGDTTATIFLLKTKGKRRGYVERSEVDTNLVINWHEEHTNSPDE